MRKGSPPPTCHMSGVTCHMSGVTCHVSHVTCHMSRVIFFFYFFLLGHSDEASQWRVCYQRLVFSQRDISVNILLSQRYISVNIIFINKYPELKEPSGGSGVKALLNLLHTAFGVGRALTQRPPGPALICGI